MAFSTSSIVALCIHRVKISRFSPRPKCSGVSAIHSVRGARPEPVHQLKVGSVRHDAPRPLPETVQHQAVEVALAVSRRHCEIDCFDGQLIVRDLGSRQGTYVNDIQIDEGPLNFNDQLRIGLTRFIVKPTA